jgi:hypothetical protein
MNQNVKFALTAVGVFAIAVSANVVAKSIYTNTKLGTDKKALLICSVIGLTASFLIVKSLKK